MFCCIQVCASVSDLVQPDIWLFGRLIYVRDSAVDFPVLLKPLRYCTFYLNVTPVNIGYPMSVLIPFSHL